ncbi:hypothetical protein [Lawsonibacter faecis]|uniref:Uncharacterized protein n=1 Tax=Lawsonibacter faecis TaxID=2763052 RepID=A0A8J6J9F3_9FIRM|nr:hypothetical protein [Lawsonibacter faecis]MBC5736078.1 hypothetical protein [Lawsonibacter faecis]
MTLMELGDALGERICSRWPDRIIYRDVCPADFERPSFFLQMTRAEASDANALLQGWDAEWSLEIFDEKDDDYVSSSERLMETQAAVLTLFGAGYVRCCGRAVSVLAVAEGREPESAFVTLRCNWFAGRPGAAVREAPPMEHLDLRLREPGGPGADRK